MEYSERGRYVTEQVALYLANEGTEVDGRRVAFRCADLADSGDLAALATFARATITSLPEAAPVRRELAVNDWERIDWAAVADEVRGLAG